jgi:hypothetical protein
MDIKLITLSILSIDFARWTAQSGHVDALASLKPPWRRIREMTSTASKTPKPRDRNCLISSKPPLDLSEIV